MQELEERIAAFKHQESAMIFTSGYQANIGIVSALMESNDLLFYDELSHASFFDAIRMNTCNSKIIKHNDIESFNSHLFKANSSYSQKYLGIEGIYSMDGDTPPLPEYVDLCKSNNVTLILDDAHGTGVLGETGSGTAEHFGLFDSIDISMGTFSKAFGLSGGFVAANRDIIRYMKYHSRSFVFSAAMPPILLAAILAALDLIIEGKEKRSKLQENVRYLRNKISVFDFCAEPAGGILSLKIPSHINIRKFNFGLHQKGLFVNAIEYPAVSHGNERLRISLMADHQKKDLDYLCECLEEEYHKSLTVPYA